MRAILCSSILAAGMLLTPSLQAKASDDVKAEQQALKDKGFDPGPIDGVSGPKTKAALREFQSKQNLKASGHLTAETRSALGMSSPSTGAAQTVKKGYTAGGKDIGHGTKEMATGVADGSKDFGKGVGKGVAKMGEATGHAAKKVGTGIKDAVTGK